MNYKDEFIKYLEYKNYSKRTIESYEYLIAQLEDFYKGDILECDKFYLMKFLTNFQPATRNTKLAGLKSFYNWLKDSGYRKDNPTKDIKRVKIRKNIPQILNLKEMTELINLESNLLYKAIFAILCTSALRIDELCKLDKNNLQRRTDSKGEEYEVMRVVGKGDKVREVPISKAGKTWLNYYLRTRADDYSPLFINNRNVRISPASVQKRLNEIGDIMGKKLHPHLLRHSCLTEMVRSGKNLFAIQKIAGHSDIKITQRYVHLANSDTKDTVDLIDMDDE